MTLKSVYAPRTVVESSFEKVYGPNCMPHLVLQGCRIYKALDNNF